MHYFTFLIGGLSTYRVSLCMHPDPYRTYLLHHKFHKLHAVPCFPVAMLLGPIHTYYIPGATIRWKRLVNHNPPVYIKLLPGPGAFRGWFRYAHQIYFINTFIIYSCHFRSRKHIGICWFNIKSRNYFISILIHRIPDCRYHNILVILDIVQSCKFDFH